MPIARLLATGMTIGTLAITCTAVFAQDTYTVTVPGGRERGRAAEDAVNDAALHMEGTRR